MLAIVSVSSVSHEIIGYDLGLLQSSTMGLRAYRIGYRSNQKLLIYSVILPCNSLES